MGDRYAINLAKTRLREAYRDADVDAILSLFSDSFTDMQDGQASFWNLPAKAALRIQLEKLFREHEIDLMPTIIDIRISGDIAVEHGWHQLTQHPKAGGPPVTIRTRYVELWQRETDLAWRIVLRLDNTDQPPELLEEGRR